MYAALEPGVTIGADEYTIDEGTTSGIDDATEEAICDDATYDGTADEAAT